MKRLRWSSLIFVAGSLTSARSAGAQAPLAPAQQIGARDSKQTISPEAALSEARQLSKQGKFDEAIRQLEVLARNQPDLKGVAHELGVAYYKKADYLKAVESFKKALEENPGDNEAVQLMGISYYLAGRPGEAIAPLEKVQTWYPSANVDAAYILGVCYIQTKDYPSARKAFAKMFGVSAESAASYLFTARMLLRQDFGPVAEEYAKKAVEVDPKLPLAHSLLGEIYLYKSRLPEATEQFQKELELNPGDAAVYYKLADAYTRSQKYDEAEKLGEERRDRAGGARAAAGPDDGSQQSHSPPFARPGLPGTRQDGRGGARTEAVRAVARSSERETVSEALRRRKDTQKRGARQGSRRDRALILMRLRSAAALLTGELLHKLRGQVTQ